MSDSIDLIFDKTIKVLKDLLHVKHACILQVQESQLVLKRYLSQNKIEKSNEIVSGSSEALERWIEFKEPILMDPIDLKQTKLSEVIKGEKYYVYTCLDSNQKGIAIIVLPIIDFKNFNAENFSLVHVVGQRLSVELEKNKVIHEREKLSEFNAFILESLEEVSWEFLPLKNEINWFGAIQKVFGYTKEIMLDDIEFFLNKIHPTDKISVEERILMNSKVNEKFSIDFQFHYAGNTYNWLRMEGILLENESGTRRVIGVVKNVQNEKMADLEQIKAMVKATDGERKRIASEIHDSLGQTLSVVRLELDALADMPETKPLFEKLTNVSALVAGAIKESRAISHDLMPPALLDYGLIAALDTMINQVNRSSQIQFKFFHNQIEERFEEDFETNIYRICQEGINNILKHANAKHSTIQLIRHPTHMYVSIEDDGIGFGQKKKVSGLGIKNMMNRVAFLGGKMEIESNHGTIITIEISI